MKDTARLIAVAITRARKREGTNRTSTRPVRVGANPKEHRMAEGKKARISEDNVVADSEDGEYEHLGCQ